MESEIVTIIVAVIGLIGTVLGAKYGAKYQEVKSAVGEVLNLFDVVYEAAKDDKITEAEFQAIVDAAKKSISG